MTLMSTSRLAAQAAAAGSTPAWATTGDRIHGVRLHEKSSVAHDIYHQRRLWSRDVARWR